MRKRAQVALAVFLLAIGGMVAWQVLRGREPVFQGKPLTAWLDGYQLGGASPGIDEAVRGIGTSAVPVLLESLQASDSALKLELAAHGLHYTLAEVRHMQGERGFAALGAAASNAVPALIEVYERNISASSRHAAGNALVAIGPAARKAIPALIKCIASTNSEERALAVSILGRIGSEAETVFPVLMKLLRDADRDVRYNAGYALGTLAPAGRSATAAIPVLLDTLKDRDATVRAAAATALGQIHAEPEVVVPALIQLLHDPNLFVRARAAEAVGGFGVTGQAATAALIELRSAKDSGSDVLQAANKALRAIDPEAAARAGVK